MKSTTLYNFSSLDIIDTRLAQSMNSDNCEAFWLFLEEFGKEMMKMTGNMQLRLEER